MGYQQSSVGNMVTGSRMLEPHPRRKLKVVTTTDTKITPQETLPSSTLGNLYHFRQATQIQKMGTAMATMVVETRAMMETEEEVVTLHPALLAQLHRILHQS